MIDPRLIKVNHSLHDWCQDHGTQYDIVCDEANIQGVMLFGSRPYGLLRHLTPLLQTEHIHAEHRKVRGGTILAFSVAAISESKLCDIIAEAGEEQMEMTFTERIENAFIETPEPITESMPTSVSRAIAMLKAPGAHIHTRQQAQYRAEDIWFNIDEARAEFPDRKKFAAEVANAWEQSMRHFEEDAMRIAETQFKTPNKGIERTREPDQRLGDQGFEHQDGSTDNDDAQATKGSKTSPTLGARKGSHIRYEERVNAALCLPKQSIKKSEFNSALREALDGIATATGAQPEDLFKKFARALRVLGQQMGLGPLQQRLRRQGISWKKSDDGQAIILTIKNAATGADQPIARISHDTLEQPNEFETQLKNMLDFATGDAPGAFQQKELEVQNRKKIIGDIAKAVTPQDAEGEVAQAMNTGTGQEVAAAQTAAMPKQANVMPQQAAPQQAAPQQAAPQQAAPQPRPRLMQQAAQRQLR